MDLKPMLETMRNDKNNLIVNMSIDFALDTIDYCSQLEEKRQLYHLKTIA